MARRFYKPRVTARDHEKADALYTTERGDAPKSDLAAVGIWTPEQEAFFRREAGLDDPSVSDAECATRPVAVARKLRADAGQVRERPSRRTFAPHPYDYGMKAIEPALGLQHTSSMNGQLHGRETILRFIRAGNATLTVVSRVTGTRFTYQFQQPKSWVSTPDKPVAPTFCKVMTGADNNSDFEFVGTMWPEDSTVSDGAQVYRHSAKARVTLSAPSVRALVWFLRTALHPDRVEDLERCEVWHEGRCGRCGRKLTVPTSVESGYGPECAGRM